MTDLSPQSREDLEAAADAYLAQLGERVRTTRARHGMTRKILSRDSGVSERYLAQLESGRGNISILLLRQLARALDTGLEALVLEGPEPAADLAHTIELLRRLSDEEQSHARRILVEAFASADQDQRLGRVALVGLRGAGKSTLGSALARKLGFAFADLDREIERESGMPLAAIFDLYGQPGFRRLERLCLDRIIQPNPQVVIATGGGLVSDTAAFERLLAGCFTVWVRASPAEHMARVMAQGDFRPMSNNREAMADLNRILKAREPLYRHADAHIDTSDQSEAESLAAIIALLPRQAAG